MDWGEESPRGMGGFEDDDDWADVEGTVKVGEARVEREEEKKDKKSSVDVTVTDETATKEEKQAVPDREKTEQVEAVKNAEGAKTLEGSEEVKTVETTGGAETVETVTEEAGADDVVGKQERSPVQAQVTTENAEKTIGAEDASAGKDSESTETESTAGSEETEPKARGHFSGGSV